MMLCVNLSRKRLRSLSGWQSLNRSFLSKILFMKKLIFFFFFLLPTAIVTPAQDTLWVKQKEGHPYLVHKVQSGENLFLLSRKYSVPPAVLADFNSVGYQDGLPSGSKFRIPVDQYNFIRIESVVKSSPIFYKAGDEDDLRSISRMFNIPQSAIQRWNNMSNPDIATGQVLQVGWVAYDKAQIPFSLPDTAKAPAVVNKAPVIATTKPMLPKTEAPTRPAPAKDTATGEASAFEQLYEQQTAGGNQTEESGAAVFYPLRAKAAEGVYYAFHNTASRGTILMITNPASGKTVYAKVIGTIPKLKEYHNAIVGLSNNAITVLKATDRRMFCKIKYR
jgi:LysM repeat protein